MRQLLENRLEITWLHGRYQRVQLMTLVRQYNDHWEITAQIWHLDPASRCTGTQVQAARTQQGLVTHHRHTFAEFFGRFEAIAHRFGESVFPFAAEIDCVDHEQFDAALRIRIVNRWDLIFRCVRNPIVDAVARLFDAIEIDQEYFDFPWIRLADERIIHIEAVIDEDRISDAQFGVIACVMLQLGAQFGDVARIQFANGVGNLLLGPTGGCRSQQRQQQLRLNRTDDQVANGRRNFRILRMRNERQTEKGEKKIIFKMSN